MLEDTSLKCVSIICETTVGEYLECIHTVYRNRGGIENQREALKTKSAISIRKRMVSDIVEGCILPPVVIGVKSKSLFEDAVRVLSKPDEESLWDTLLQHLNSSFDACMINNESCEADSENCSEASISLIDGMQRTGALIEAVTKSQDVRERKLRIELWLTDKNNSLLYRMLILNSGQIPWDIRRQLEVLFQSITTDVQREIPELEVFRLDNSRRRAKQGVYQANDLIEMFIAFGSRKDKVELKEHIANEFTRLDFVEASNKTDLVESFIRVLKIFVRLEKNFYRHQEAGESERRKFKDGGDLMSSQPMRIGFITACAVEVFGRPGRDKTKQEAEANLDRLEKKFDNFLSQLENINDVELAEFIDIPTLNGSLPTVTSRIGEHDREFFRKAFSVMIESIDNLPSMTSCWRAY